MHVVCAVGTQDIEAVGDQRHDAGAEADGHVDVHGEGINQALSGRMGALGRGGGGRRLAEAGAGGVDAPLNAVGERAAQHTAEYGVGIEGTSQHHGNRRGNRLGVEYQDRHCDD